ncbi:hypothetical protein [Pseudomonas frederiksbergensis]|uniref:hypothetical protein n=1 Tax=Pseudomonas frederiksbergensis TaxID=104087 RepID=UPI003D20C0A7
MSYREGLVNKGCQFATVEGFALLSMSTGQRQRLGGLRENRRNTQRREKVADLS